MNKVSIIIPIYNVSDYMDQCIQSACNQTYTNIEIILVDDGSTDDSGRKCDSWSEQDDRIQVVHKNNGGLSSARNAGLDVATGTYIYFLDGDDYIAPTLLEQTIPHMDGEFDMVVLGHYYVSDDGKITVDEGHESNIYFLESNNDRISFFIYTLLRGRIGWEAWDRIYRRELIERYNLRFEDNQKIFAEDLCFCLCYCAHAKKVVSLTDLLYYYRKRESSIMGTDGKKFNLGRMNELSKRVLGFYQKWNDCRELVNVFPVIHFMIMNRIITGYRSETGYSDKEIRNAIKKDVQDMSFFKKNIAKLRKYRILLYPLYDTMRLEEQLNKMQYYATGNFVEWSIRNRIAYKNIKQLENVNTYKLQKTEEFQQCGKRIFLLGSENWGNIGDYKIAECIIEFIKEYFNECKIIEIPASRYYEEIPWLKRFIKKEDLIIMPGGGNLGDQYLGAQRIRNDIILRWRENAKIIFPQTIFFSKSQQGLKELMDAKEIYTFENNIILFCREKVSYEFAQMHFNCESYLVPDIVLFCNEQKNMIRDDNILFCMRSDVEKTVSNEVISQLKKKIQTMGYDAMETDFQLPYHVPIRYRTDYIEDKLQLVQKSKLVITDRLHGMVFAAITGTPCIVFSNYNHKIDGTYEWIKYLSYIKLAKSVEEANSYIVELLTERKDYYDNTPMKPYFEEIAKKVQEKCQ